jgi:putative hydrolase of the HAD superfamily
VHRSIQAVTFDVGGTLIDPYPSVGHIYSEVAAQCGANALDPELLNQRFRHVCRVFARPLQSALDWTELVDRVFDGLVQRPPSQTFFRRLYDRFRDPGVWCVHHDVRPVLDRLRRAKIRTAVISNWDDRLRPLLDRLGLSEWLEPIIVSCEVKASKPDPAIFITAAAALNLTPAHILHVGDDRRRDLEAARRAGFQALLLDRRSRRARFPRIRTLLDVADFLESPSRHVNVSNVSPQFN